MSGNHTYKLMRIATVPGTFALQLQGQVAYLLQQGWQVQVVSSPASQWYRWPSDIPAHCITELPMRRSIHPRADVVALWHLCKLLRTHRPHIVHTHSPKAGLLGMLAARLCRVPIRLHTLAGTPYTTARGLRRRILWLAEWLTQACSTHTWVLSQGLLQQGLQAGFLQQGKCSMQGYGSSNGVDYARFALATPDAALAELEARGTQPEGRQVWLYVGRLVHEKGLDELLAAFAALQARHPQHLLVCIGPLEPERDPLKPESLRLLHQHPAVVHIPWSGHIPAWLKLAHCLVHPSHREGLPNVLLEAGAAGCPILASRIAGNTDVVSSEALGYLFTPGDPQDLLQKMLAMQVATPEEKAGKAALLQQLVAARYERRQVQEALHLAYKAQLEHAGFLPHSA